MSNRKASSGDNSQLTTPPKGWLTAKQAAAKLGILDYSYVGRLCLSGKLDGKKVELMPGMSYWFVDPKSIQQNLDSPQTRGYPRGRPRSGDQEKDYKEPAANASKRVVETAPANNAPKAGEAKVSVKRPPRGIRKVQSGNRTFTMPVKHAAVLLLAQKSKSELGKVELLNALHDQFGFTFGRRPYNAGSTGGINKVCESLDSEGFVTRRQLKGSNVKVIKVTPAGAAVVVLDSI